MIMHIQYQKGANYLVADKNEYNPKKETLYFGETKIVPGTKIKKIGVRKRTSFEMMEGSYLQYEGTINIDNVKHCVFSSTWDDNPEEPIYRYVFAMANTRHPEFLYLQNKTGHSGCDIDCRIVTKY